MGWLRFALWPFRSGVQANAGPSICASARLQQGGDWLNMCHFFKLLLIVAIRDSVLPENVDNVGLIILLFLSLLLLLSLLPPPPSSPSPPPSSIFILFFPWSPFPGPHP